MKNYMNEKEKDNHLFMCHLKQVFDEVISSNFYSKEEVTNFKKANTFLKKALDNVINRLDVKYAKQLNRINKECNLYLIPDMKLKAMTIKDGQLTINEKDFYMLVENASYKCRHCDGCEDFKKCVNYQSMLKVGTPFVYVDTPIGLCPYKLEPTKVNKEDFEYEYKRMQELNKEEEKN